MSLYSNTREFIDAVQTHLNASLNTLNSQTSCEFFGDQEILNLATEQLYSILVPDIKKQNEDYFVVSEVFKVSGDNVLGFGLDNFGLYPFGSPMSSSIPKLLKRAIGSQIVSLQYLEDPSHQMGLEVQRISRDTVQKTGGTWYRTAGYMMENDKFVLWPHKDFDGRTLRVFYFRRPNKLVPPEKCAQVISTNPTTKTVNFGTVVPSEFVSGIKVDVIRGQSAYGPVYDSQPATSISTYSLVLPSVENIEAGDWVCLEGQAPVVQIPQDFWVALVYLTVSAVYAKFRYTKMIDVFMGQYQQIMKAGIATNSTPRTIDQSKPLTNFDSSFNWVI